MSRTAEEWGRIAVSLPGWRWMPGMQTLPLPTPGLPDPDDPATAGCLLAMLLPPPALGHVTQILPPMSASRDLWTLTVDTQWGRHTIQATTLGRACIAAAAAIGRWPEGDL